MHEHTRYSVSLLRKNRERERETNSETWEFWLILQLRIGWICLPEHGHGNCSLINFILFLSPTHTDLLSLLALPFTPFFQGENLASPHPTCAENSLCSSGFALPKLQSPTLSCSSCGIAFTSPGCKSFYFTVVSWMPPVYTPPRTLAATVILS